MTTQPKLKKQITYSGAMDIKGNDVVGHGDYSHADLASSPDQTGATPSFNRTNSFTITEEQVASSPQNRFYHNQNDINNDINSMNANTDTKCYVLHRTKEVENLTNEEDSQQKQQQQQQDITSLLSSSPSSHLKRTAEVENLNELEWIVLFLML